jgi:hypothetical protein
LVFGRPRTRAIEHPVYRIEHLHPLEGGIFRLKYRRDRRKGMPIEHPLVFYPKYGAEIARKLGQYAVMVWNAYRVLRRVERDPSASSYRDLAITPPAADEMETLAMFQETSGGEAAVAKKRRADDLRDRVAKLQAAE